MATGGHIMFCNEQFTLHILDQENVPTDYNSKLIF